MIGNLPIRAKLLLLFIILTIPLLVCSILFMLYSAKTENKAVVSEAVNNSVNMLEWQYKTLNRTGGAEQFQDILSNTDVGFDSMVFLLGPGGKLKAAGPKEQVSELQLQNEAIQKTFSNILKKQEGKLHLFEKQSGLHSYMVMYQRLEGASGSILAVMLPQEKLFSAAALINIKGGIISVCILIAVLIVWFIFSGKIVKPVQSVSRELKKLAEAKGNLSVSLEDSGSDEVGKLIDSFNSFLKQLNRDISEIRNSSVKFNFFSADIATSSYQLSQRAGEQADLMNGIVGVVERFKAKLSELSNGIHTLYSAISENMSLYRNLNENTAETRENITELERDIESTMKATKNGNSWMGSTLSEVSSLKVSMEDIHKNMAGIEERVKKIEEVLETITSISADTHVLATNASIEAARAGKEGEGFGVIAREIRNLSDSTQQAVEKIEQYTGAVSKSVKDTFVVSEEGANKAQTVRNVAENTKQSFSSIEDSIQKVKQTLKQVNEVFDKQQEVSDKISESSNSLEKTSADLNSIIDGQTEGYEHITKRIEDSAELSGHFAQSAKALYQLGKYLKVAQDQLSAVVERFTLGEVKTAEKKLRKEERGTLLYNLEVLDSDGNPYGYLADISKSGCLLLTEKKNIKKDSKYSIQVLPPMSEVLERDSIFFTIVVRSLSDTGNNYLKAGCQILHIDEKNTRQLDSLIKNFTIEHRLSDTMPSVYSSQKADLEKEQVAEDLEVVEELEEVD